VLFRYDRWLPELTNIPRVINSSSMNPCNRQFNLTALHHLDSSRFIVSLSDVDDRRTTSDRHVRPLAVMLPRIERRRKKNKSNVKSWVSSTTSTDTAVIDLDCFRFIFVAVDVAIVAFHLCRGYIDLQRCRGRCLNAGVDLRSLRNGGLTTSTDQVEDRAGLGRLLSPALLSDGVVPAVYEDARTSTTVNDYTTLHEHESDVATCLEQRSSDVLQQQRRQSHVVARTTYVVARTTMVLVGRIVRSRSLLPLLACAFILAVTHCVIRTCSRLTAPHPILSGGTLTAILATSVRFQTSTANAHLSEDTRHLDSSVLQLSSTYMTEDLHSLLGIVDYFRQGLNATHSPCL